LPGVTADWLQRRAPAWRHLTSLTAAAAAAADLVEHHQLMMTMQVAH